MMFFVRKIFTPPQMDTPEANRVARQLHFILMLGIPLTFSIALLIHLIADEIDRVAGAVASGTMSVLLTFMLYLLQRHKAVRAVSIILIGSSFATIFIKTTIKGGVDDPAIIVLLVLLILTSVFLDGRATVILGGFTAVGVAALFIVERFHILPVEVVTPTSTAAFIITILAVILTTIFLRATVDQIVQNSQHMQRQAATLQESNEQLERIREALEKRTAELSTTLSNLQAMQSELIEAKETAEMANKAKSEFLSNMSHELRTPLNGILGYTQILKNDPALTYYQIEQLDIIHESGRHLLTLISDILDLSKIEARRLELHPAEVNVVDFLDGIAGLMRLRAQQKGLAFNYEMVGELPFSVEMDQKRMRQVLINLLGNSIKFTEDGHVTLRITNLSAAAAPKVRLRFEVIDTGVGLAESELQKIFLPFEQVGDQRSRADGTGLGLTISQDLVQAMGGNIEVHSQLGEGSCFGFEVELPVIAAPIPTEAAARRTVIGFIGTPQKVLIVDDKAHNRSLLRSLLEPLGFETTQAANGLEALQIARTFQPTVILMDLVMPVMGGLEAVRKLRQMKLLSEIAMFIISANVSAAKRQECLDAGADAFIAKPIEMSQLLTYLSESLPIEWVYSSQKVANLLPEEQEEELDMELPEPGWLDDLYARAVVGDMTAVEQMALTLAANDARYRVFCSRIQELARSFEDETLIALIQRYRTQRTH